MTKKRGIRRKPSSVFEQNSKENSIRSHFMPLLILGRHYIFTKAYVGKMFGKSYKLQQLGENEKLGWDQGKDRRR